MSQMHSLLRRQLKRSFGDSFTVPDEWQGLIDAIDQAYLGFDLDREMLERSLELSSQELLEANTQMRAIFQAIPDLLFRLDSDGTILEVKAGSTTDFLIQPQELFGKRIQDIPFKTIGNRFLEALKRVQAEKTVIHIEYSLPIQKEENYFEARLAPLRNHQVIAIIRNVTFRMKREALIHFQKDQLEAQNKELQAQRAALEQAEKELRQFNMELEQRVNERTAELQAAIRELDAFSYSISHDLRAPLRRIDGYSRILAEDYSAHLPPEALYELGRVRNNCQMMGQLIDDLLTFSRANRAPLETEPVSLPRLVKEVLEDLKTMQEGRQVKIIVADLPTCRADPSLLKQVFVNLLSNALKFTRERDEAVIEINYQGDGNGHNVYFVRDNGVGFDMRNADKLFGVFQRLHSNKEYEGTGVGLSIVQRIILRHGGRIWTESEVGKGATFYFTLDHES